MAKLRRTVEDDSENMKRDSVKTGNDVINLSSACEMFMVRIIVDVAIFGTERLLLIGHFGKSHCNTYPKQLDSSSCIT
jgi:hypothetical protein